MNPVVAVVAPGMMGAAVAGRLVESGLKVLTSLSGRSADTVARAKKYGLTAASDEEIAAADFILSILPPGDAVSLAQRFAPALTAGVELLHDPGHPTISTGLPAPLPSIGYPSVMERSERVVSTMRWRWRLLSCCS